MTDAEFQVRLKELAEDRQHGASELARQALEILAASSLTAPAKNLSPWLRSRSLALKNCRPSMAPIQRLLSLWEVRLQAQSSMNPAEIRQAATAAAHQLIQQSRQAVGTTVGEALSMIRPPCTIITHSLSSTVSQIFEGLRGTEVDIIVSESRPLNEGHLLVRQLCEWGISCRLITDAQLGLFAAESDLALVGADSILADGTLINKSGTYLLALAARAAGIPFYVAAESFKRHQNQMPVILEEMAPGELGAPSLPGLQVSNIYFDRTPARLISAWINEHGPQPLP